MGENSLLQHYTDLRTSFCKSLEICREGYSKSDLHQLRVSIKKLRTTWLLIEALSHGKWNRDEHLALFFQLFDAAGEVREAQINLNIIGQYDNPTLVSYVTYLGEQQTRANEQLLEQLQVFDLEQLNVLDSVLIQQLADFGDEEVIREAGLYAAEGIRHLLETDWFADDRTLHDIRKQLKLTHDVRLIVMKLKHEEKPDELHETFDAAINQIGHWHDYCQLLKSIRKFATDNASGQESAELDKIIACLAAEHEASRLEIQQLRAEYAAQLSRK